MEARAYFKELHEAVLKIHKDKHMRRGAYFLLSSKMGGLLSREERRILEGTVKAPRKKFVNYGDNG
tara:strand:+ start:70 stop:267 length:198 start_codon:yes stop_codon:yes gene_type:complete